MALLGHLCPFLQVAADAWLHVLVVDALVDPSLVPLGRGLGGALHLDGLLRPILQERPLEQAAGGTGQGILTHGSMDLRRGRVVVVVAMCMARVITPQARVQA
mmetsp:Transcript_20654/g.65360  ORF Transcript_20654/g.65360 Transcript_20654/m.65360 type:complete len:103 (+) Transcript_20654:1727-2035(+)